MLEYLLILGFFIFYVSVLGFLDKKRDLRSATEAFIMGIVVAVLSAVVQTLPSEFYPSFYSSMIRIILIAPLTEEALKFYGCLRYFAKRIPIESTRKAALYGYGVGLSFGTFESLIVAFTGYPLIGIFLRVLLTMPMHIIAAMISAYGIGYTFRTGKRQYYSLLFLGSAVTIHVLFNYSAVLFQP